VPDLTQKFGAATSGPLVWHTYRSKSEIFPGANKAMVVTHGYKVGAPAFGYHDPPQYQYASPIAACAGQGTPSSPAWVNLDEITQIGLDTMYAGTVPAKPTSANGQPQLIRFLAKANQAEYAYVAQNQYWFNGPARRMAQANFTGAVKNGFPVKRPFINLPNGTVEIKAAFRPLTAAEAARQRASGSTSLVCAIYEGGEQPCFRDGQWGLVALHIIQKTPSAPAFVFATFEQADNIQAVAGGKSVALEDETGNIVHSPAPAAAYCATDGNPHLFYRNTATLTAIPTGGNICVNQREHADQPVWHRDHRRAPPGILAPAHVSGIYHGQCAGYSIGGTDPAGRSWRRLEHRAGVAGSGAAVRARRKHRANAGRWFRALDNGADRAADGLDRRRLPEPCRDGVGHRAPGWPEPEAPFRSNQRQLNSPCHSRNGSL
jgi:hypothetical protein